MSRKRRVRAQRKSQPADIAHDMRTPLAVLHGFLRATQLNADVSLREYHTAAMNAWTKLEKMAQHLSMEATVSSDSVGFHDVVEIVHRAMEQFRSAAEKNDVSLLYVGPKHVIGQVDPLAIDRLVSNKISNALQATHGGIIRVQVFSDQGHLFIEVSDSGAGIAQHTLPHVFQRGFTEGAHRGSGIGLHVCKKIVEEHGGEILVHSRSNCGSVFTSVFPHLALVVADEGMPSTFLSEETLD